MASVSSFSLIASRQGLFSVGQYGLSKYCSCVRRVSGLLGKDDGCRVATSALVPLALSPDAFLVFHEALGRPRDSKRSLVP